MLWPKPKRRKCGSHGARSQPAPTRSRPSRETLQVATPARVPGKRQGNSCGSDSRDDLKELQAQLERAHQTTQQKRTAAQDAHAALTALRARLDDTESELEERGVPGKRSRTDLCPAFPAMRPCPQRSAPYRRGKKSWARRSQTWRRGPHPQSGTKRSCQANVKAPNRNGKAGRSPARTAERLEVNARESAAQEREIAAFLTTDQDPEQRVAHRLNRVRQAEQQLQEADHAARQADLTLNDLNTQQVQKKGDLRLVAAEYESAVLRAEHEAQAVRECLGLTADALLPKAEEVEAELTVLSDKQAGYAELSQREENLRTRHDQAERQARDSHADLQVRTRVLEEAREKQHQAQSRLEHEREALEEAIAQHSLADAGEDGAHIKRQLESVRSQRMSLQEQRGRLEAEHAEAGRRWQEKEQEEDKLAGCGNRTAPGLGPAQAPGLGVYRLSFARSHTSPDARCVQAPARTHPRALHL